MQTRIETIAQDNYSELVGLRLCYKLGDFTLAAPTTIDTRTFTATAGHGLAVGNIVCIRENKRHFQARVSVVAGNTITLDTPMDFSATSAAECFRSRDNLNMDGSVSPLICTLRPPAGSSWDILGCSFHLQSTSAMDDAKFGSLTALTNGIVVRRKDGVYKTIFNIKDNGEFSVRCDEAKYADKAAAGTYGFSAKKTFGIRHGTVIRLRAEYNEEFQVIIQDNLTGLAAVRVAVWGHVVT